MAAPNDIAHWRARIFAKLLLIVFLLGLATAVPSMLLAAGEGMWSIIVIDVIALSWIGAILLLRRVAYTVRVFNFLAVAFVVGVGLLLKIGPVSQIYLMAIPVLAALLLGLRPALWMLLLAGLAVLVLGFDENAKLQIEGMPDHAFLKSAIISINFMFITAVLTLSCAVLLQQLARSFDELRAGADSLERLAFFDVLTGLPNRRLLMDRVDTLLASSARSATFSAVMFVDLDRFKTINDARGHAIGDALLCKAAGRLSQLVRKADTVARIGGDEFVVVLAHLADDLESATHAARAVAEKVRVTIGQEFEIDGQLYTSTASIGVTMLPKPRVGAQPEQTAHDLLREADTAMYRAKAEGRNGIAFFEMAMQTAVEQRLSMERDLASALAGGELQMHVQPQVDRDGRAIGGELLMRWPLAGGAMVPPSVFIPVAEESGLILALGAWALRQACEAVLLLERAGLAMPLSVNVSPSQFRQPDFVVLVQRTLADTGAPADRLILEVTEGLLIDKLDETIARMHQLTALGLRFSIDDFGTGYSSLAYLKKMPLYELKIDRSFIIDAPDDSSSAALVQSILAMAGHLGLHVVAEGVETRAQADFLIGHGCPCLQGYLYGRPMPLALLIGQLGSTAARSRACR
ncbi:diguanylate cyclase (GGDEF) domain-containing protein [Duganella sp. CF517]|uniref:putative bifunctional diguanylate cyclase/phosphodiesterase n=1 Tax=Duganella sp. CF517 TaxID=1881038 RepID=UPI0008CE2502|nr:GGDEF domain-containing phosphodiesterase [Duganella sp. CF517]SEO52941.1 diguanylate cyclase (GGDEF) domain-containing protein [Duganella sp. CF517]